MKNSQVRLVQSTDLAARRGVLLQILEKILAHSATAAGQALEGAHTMVFGAIAVGIDAENGLNSVWYDFAAEVEHVQVQVLL